MTRDELIEKLKTIGNGSDQVIFQKWESINGYGNSDYTYTTVDDAIGDLTRIVLS